MIKVEQLYKEYGPDIKVLFDVNFTFEDSKTYAIIGSSGGGKSTLIRCLNLLEEPTSGSVYFNDIKVNDPKTNLAAVREKVGMVFQNFNLFEHMVALDNVTYALKKVKKLSKEEAESKGRALLEKVGLGHRINAYPHQMSGGEKQRCAIARALAMEPEVLLFDEPTSALDPEMTSEVLKVLQDLNHTGMTMIIVTHEMNFAKHVADYVIYMDKGKIEECSKAKEFFEQPKSARAKEFLSNMI